MFLALALTVLLLPLGVGLALPFISFVQRRRVTMLRLLLTLSMLPWLTFLKDMTTRGVPLSMDYDASFTWLLFVRATSLWVILALGVWILALYAARRLPLLIVGLPLLVAFITVFGTLESVRAAAMLTTAAGEPDNGFYFDGLYTFWYLAFSLSACLGLVGFVLSAYWFEIRRNLGGLSPFAKS